MAPLKNPKTSSKAASKTAAKAAPAPVFTPAPRLEKIAKAELVDLMATRASLSKKAAAAAFDAALEAIVETLKGGAKIGLPGLGTLEVRQTQARAGVRPGTSEKIEIPAGKKIAFKLASDFKSALNR